MAQENIGSNLLQVGVSGVEERRASGLAQDIGNLFGSVAKGVETYNTIGETAAKLQASDDITQFKSQVATLKSSLAYADKKPEIYLEVQKRIDELGAEMVAKSEKLSNHKAAYDVYKNYTSEAYSDVAASYEPVAQAGFMKESSNKKTFETISKANTAWIVPSSIELEASKASGLVLGQTVDEYEGEVANPHLNAMDSELKSKNPTVIASNILTNGLVDRAKVSDYLNTMTGSLVRYVTDKDGNVTLDTKIESSSIKEEYMKRHNSLIERFTKKERDEPNLDLAAMKKNVTENKIPSYTFDALNEKYANDTKAIDTYINSDGYATASKMERIEQYGIWANSMNTHSEGTAAINTMLLGEPITQARFTQVEVSLDNEKNALLTTKDMSKQVSEDVVNGMITSYTLEVSDAIKNGTGLNEMVMSSMIKSKPSNAQVFEDALIGSIKSGGNLGTVEFLEDRVKAFNIFGQTSNTLGSRGIYADASRFLGRYLSDYNKLPEGQDKVKRGQVILDLASAYQSTIPTKIQIEKIVTSTNTNEVYKLLDMEGINVSPDNISESLVEEAYYQYRMSMNRDPSIQQQASFISDNGASLKKVFGWEWNTPDIVVLRPTNSNGQRITSEVFYKGIHDYKNKHNIDLNEYDFITTSTSGKSTGVQIVKKDTGALLAILDGDYFDKNVKIAGKHLATKTKAIVEKNKSSARKANESLFNLFK